MSDYFDRIESQLVHAAQTRSRRVGLRPRVVLGSAIAAAVVVVVVAVVVIAGGTGRRSGNTAPAAGSTPTAIILASSVAAGPGLVTALNADVTTLRHRLEGMFPDVRVARVGQTVVLSDVLASQRPAVLALTEEGQLQLLDWETNVLLPGGHTVASLLPHQDRQALATSQGFGSAVPGDAAAGGLPLYQAVKLAARQPSSVGTAASGRSGAQYFLFRKRCRPSREQSCLLAGPAPGRQALLAALAPGISSADSRLYVVPGTLEILQASMPGRTELPSFADLSTRYFVAINDPALTGADLTNARPSTDQSGNPDVTFTFSPAGERAFRRVTAAVAHRGNEVSSSAEALNQHFAITLDDRILTVPSIDFKTYPDGITGSPSADITGVLTKQTARELAAMLQSGPLAVPLSPRF